MTLGCWQATITDESGNIQPNASVEFRAETPGQPLVSLWADRTGGTPISNPTTADIDGFVRVFAVPQAHQIVASLGGGSPSAFSRTWRYVPIGSMGERDSDELDTAQSDIATAQSDLTIHSSTLLKISQAYIAGLELSNAAGDPTNDITIQDGVAGSLDGTHGFMELTSVFTKQLDAAWATGTNAGGRDTGAISNNWWHVFLIDDSSGNLTPDILFSLSSSSPTMPAGYDKKRRIGSFLRTGGSIKTFLQRGHGFGVRTYYWDVIVQDVSTNNPGTSAVTPTLTVPTGYSVEAIFGFFVNNISTGGANVLVTSPDQTNTAPTAGLRNYIADAPGAATPSDAIVTMRIFTNTSAQIRYRLSASDANFTAEINTIGWVDHVGG